MAFPKGFEPKREMNPYQKKNLAQSILSDNVESPEEDKGEENTVACPNCGAMLSLETKEEADEEHGQA